MDFSICEGSRNGCTADPKGPLYINVGIKDNIAHVHFKPQHEFKSMQVFMLVLNVGADQAGEIQESQQQKTKVCQSANMRLLRGVMKRFKILYITMA